MTYADELRRKARESNGGFGGDIDEAQAREMIAVKAAAFRDNLVAAARAKCEDAAAEGMFEAVLDEPDTRQARYDAAEDAAMRCGVSMALLEGTAISLAGSDPSTAAALKAADGQAMDDAWLEAVQELAGEGLHVNHQPAGGWISMSFEAR